MKYATLRAGLRVSLLGGLVGLSSLLAVPPVTPPAGMVRVEPRETDELFGNPGMGWQTFHRFADQDPNLQGLPSSSAYFRFYWREIEPEDGRIDFGRFDELLAHARRAGQKLAFRIMCTGSGQYMDVPAWLKEQGCKGIEFSYGGRKHWVPDFADPLFQETHFRLIRELGRRYDGHPDLDLLDIGSVGLWGEWHMSGTSAVETGRPVSLPSVAMRLAIIDAWCQAFPRTSKVILIGSEEGMRGAAEKGYGWRADCLGDMGGFSKTWNHMDHFYLQQLAKTGAGEAWQHAPIAWESCWDMRKWKEEGWDIRHIFDYGLSCHASYMNNKSAPIPEGACGEVERFLRRLGYRLVIRSVAHEESVRAGSAATVTVEWENVGVAPPYRDYHVGLQLKPNQASHEPVVVVTDASIRGWLPGARQTKLSLPLAESVQPGRYRLAIGVVDPADKDRALRLAIAGRDTEGWYPVSDLEVVAGPGATAGAGALPRRGLHLSAPAKSELSMATAFVREVLAREGVNTLILEFGYTFNFQSRPEFANPSALDKDDVQQLVKVCRETGIELVPQINCLGHQSWAKRNGRLLEKHPEFDETPGKYPDNEGIYCRSYCPLHPEVHGVLFDLIDELAAACEAKAFHVGLDEVFILADPDCPRCRGKDPAELFAGEVKTLHGHLRRIGCRMWMWGDRLLDGASTGLGKWEASENGTHAAVDLVPKDIVICDWHYEKAPETPRFFAGKGFEVLASPWRKADVALAQLAHLKALRRETDPAVAGCAFGMLQTTWCGFSRFAQGYQARRAGEPATEGSAAQAAACFATLFEAMRAPE